MAVKKKGSKKQPAARARRAAPRRPARRAARTSSHAAHKASAKAPVARATGALDDLTETLDIMLPELASRLAALEHLLVERKLCAREDLRRALAFVDMRRHLP